MRPETVREKGLSERKGDRRFSSYDESSLGGTKIIHFDAENELLRWNTNFSHFLFFCFFFLHLRIYIIKPETVFRGKIKKNFFLSGVNPKFLFNRFIFIFF